MNRRNLLALLASASVRAPAGRIYFFAPSAGWLVKPLPLQVGDRLVFFSDDTVALNSRMLSKIEMQRLDAALRLDIQECPGGLEMARRVSGLGSEEKLFTLLRRP